MNSALLLSLTLGHIAAESPPALPAPITYAIDRFNERGAEYKLGPNDCSVFVTDYMKARGKQVKRRWTTAEIWKPNLMADMQMRQVRYGTVPEAVFCIRYINEKKKWVGHCGLVLVIEGQAIFVHNSEASGGVIVESGFSFEARMLGVGVSLDQMRFFAP